MATLQHTRLHWDFRHTFLPGWPRFLPLPRQQGHHDFMGKPLNPPSIHPTKRTAAALTGPGALLGCSHPNR